MNEAQLEILKIELNNLKKVLDEFITKSRNQIDGIQQTIELLEKKKNASSE